MNKPVKQLKLVVKDGGIIHSIYDDALIPILDEAEVAQIGRASHVEPRVREGASYWQADLTPVGGPILTNFKTRKEALDAEVQYLNRHIIE